MWVNKIVTYLCKSNNYERYMWIGTYSEIYVLNLVGTYPLLLFRKNGKRRAKTVSKIAIIASDTKLIVFVVGFMIAVVVLLSNGSIRTVDQWAMDLAVTSQGSQQWCTIFHLVQLLSSLADETSGLILTILSN